MGLGTLLAVKVRALGSKRLPGWFLPRTFEGNGHVATYEHCPILRGRPCAACDRFPEGYGSMAIPGIEPAPVDENGEPWDEWHP